MNENPSYFHLERLDADNNWIESLLDLEGTNFIQNFHILHLRKNRLKSVCQAWVEICYQESSRLTPSILYFRFHTICCHTHWIEIQKDDFCISKATV